MAVESRISSKTYKTNVDELEPNDQGLKSELYEVSIFNHLINISPGLVIKEDNLSYCYVYAIKNNKVSKKIGVYETLDESPDVFDLSTFSEGSLCLFDVYERNPSLILELEEVKSQKNVQDTVFDYLLTKINDDEPDKKTTLTKNSYKGILLILNEKKKVQEDENSRIITNLLNIIKKSISIKKYFNETTQDAIKKYAKDLNKKILSLIVSEPFLKVRFIFTKDDEVYDDSEFREWSIKTDITEYVIVSVDTFEVLETYPADGLSEKYSNMLVETMPQGTSLNKETEPKDVPIPKVVPITKMATIAEDKSVSFKAPKVDPFEVDLNAEEPKAESKAESKADSKSKSKTKPKTKSSKKETKDTAEVDLNAEEPKREGFDLDLNAIDETVPSKQSAEPSAKPSAKPSSKSKKAEFKSEPEVDLNAEEPETKTPKESKTESKKLKTPGASIRTKPKVKSTS
jgi:hypothetical protein